MTTREAARDLADGDLIDLSQIPESAYVIQIGDKAANDEFGYARVGSESGPHERRGNGLLWLHTDQGTVEVAEDWVFEIHGSDR